MPTLPWTRRRFLAAAGGASLAVGLGACGGDETTEESFRYDFAPLFSPENVLVAGLEQRIPLAILDGGAPTVSGPERLDIEVRRGSEVLDTVSVDARSQISGLSYFPLRTTLPEPGIYDLVSVTDGWPLAQPVQAFARADVPLLVAGDPFPSIETPTFDDAGGVDPICTQAPDPCPLHDVTAASLLAAGEPFLLLVATPAYCQTAFCGPTLFHVVAAAAETPGLRAVHTEVYANPREVDGNLGDPDLREAPVVEALGLTFEPSLFVVGGDGLVSDQLDNVVDRTEIDEAVARVL